MFISSTDRMTRSYTDQRRVTGTPKSQLPALLDNFDVIGLTQPEFPGRSARRRKHSRECLSMDGSIRDIPVARPTIDHPLSGGWPSVRGSGQPPPPGRSLGRSAAGPSGPPGTCSSARRIESWTRSRRRRVWALRTRVPRMPSRPLARPQGPAQNRWQPPGRGRRR